MSKDEPVVVERLMLYNVEQFEQERSEALEKAAVVCVTIMVVVALLVFVLTGTASVFWALLWGG